VFKYKPDEKRFKARLVVRGDLETNIIKSEIHVYTAAFKHFRMFLAISAKRGYNLTAADAINAFLLADIAEED
jgi:hypothetical protein